MNLVRLSGITVSAAVLALALSVTTSPAQDSVGRAQGPSDPVFPRTVPRSGTYDVVVVGAGTGGISAAIQAARLGARVAVLEESDWVGGQMTAAGVSTMDGSAEISHSGLYAEFVDRIRTHYARAGKSIATCYWSLAQICFEPLAAQRVLKDMVDQANASAPGRMDVFLRAPVAAVVKEGTAVRGVRLANGAELRAKVTIEATEYGDLLPLAGVPYRVGNSRSGSVNQNACVQDVTYPAIIKKYPLGIPASLKIPGPPSGYDAARPLFELFVAPNGSSSLAWLPVNFAYHNAYRGMPNSSEPGSYTTHQTHRVSKTGVNWTNDYPATARFIEDRAHRKEAICAAKLRTIQFLYYVQAALGEPWSVADDEGFDTAYYREDNDCPDVPGPLKAIECRLP